MEWLLSLQIGFCVLCVGMSLAISISFFYLLISLTNKYVKPPKTIAKKTQRTKKNKEPEALVEDVPKRISPVKPVTEDIPLKFGPKPIEVESSFSDGNLGKIEKVPNSGG